VHIWTVCNNIDIDTCTTNNGGCSTDATCTSNSGSFTCTCLPGYNGDGFTCTGYINIFYVMPIGSALPHCWNVYRLYAFICVHTHTHILASRSPAINVGTTVFRYLQNIEPSLGILFFFWIIVQFLEILIETNVFFSVQY